MGNKMLMFRAFKCSGKYIHRVLLYLEVTSTITGTLFEIYQNGGATWEMPMDSCYDCESLPQKSAFDTGLLTKTQGMRR